MLGEITTCTSDHFRSCRISSRNKIGCNKKWRFYYTIIKLDEVQTEFRVTQVTCLSFLPPSSIFLRTDGGKNSIALHRRINCDIVTYRYLYSKWKKRLIVLFFATRIFATTILVYCLLGIAFRTQRAAGMVARKSEHTRFLCQGVVVVFVVGATETVGLCYQRYTCLVYMCQTAVL